MSLTAGFDMTVAFSASLMRNLILTALPDLLPVKGPRMLPGLKFAADLPQSEAVEMAFSAILRSVKTKLEQSGDETRLRIDVRFDSGSIAADVLATPACPLKGAISIVVPLAITVTQTLPAVSVQQAVFDFSAAELSVDFDDATPLEDAFPDGTQGVQSALAAALSNLATGAGALASVDVGPAVTVTAVGGGSLTPLVATAYAVRAVAGGLVLFMNLTAATKSNGDPSSKQTLGIPSSRNTALQISPATFHGFVWCPGLAKQFGVPVSGLPTSCGSGSVPMYVPSIDENVDLTKIAERFEDGRIVVDGELEGSYTCWDLTGSYSGQVTFPAGLTPKWTVIDADADVDVAWYCEAAAAVIGYLTGGTTIAMAAVIGVEIFEATKDASAPGMLAAAVAGFALPSTQLGSGTVPSTTFDKVEVFKDGLSIAGFRPVSAPPYTGVQSSMTLEGAVSATNSQVIEEGEVIKTTPCMADGKEYHYVLSRVSELASYQIDLEWIGLPLVDTQWRILVPNKQKTASEVYPLDGTGTVAIEVETILPNLDAPVIQKQPVEIEFDCGKTGVSLRNVHPELGGYTFRIEALSTFCDGSSLSAQRAVTFTGVTLDIVGYDKDVNDCSAKWWSAIAGSIGQQAAGRPATRLQMVNLPPPEEFTRFARDAVAHAQAAGLSGPGVAAMLTAGHVQSTARSALHEMAMVGAVLGARTEGVRLRAAMSRLDEARRELDAAAAVADGAVQRVEEARLAVQAVELEIRR